MPKNYGPNSTKVENYINLLPTITLDRAKSFSLADWSTGELRKAIDEFFSLGNKRGFERELAAKEAEEGIGHEIPDDLHAILVFLAQWLVVEDLLGLNTRTFMGLYLLAQLFDGETLHANYRKEDWAIRGFCDRLSEIDGEVVSIDSDLDQRGTAGENLPDFRIIRRGELFTLEHTSLPSFDGQYRYQHLGSQIDRRALESRLFEEFSGNRVKVVIPIEQLKSAKSVKQIDIRRLVINLAAAVRMTEPSYNAQRFSAHTLPDSKLDVLIAVDKSGGYRGFWIDWSVPVTTADIPENLRRAFIRALGSKHRKLVRAKERGENTILLIDSQDIAFTNIHILADAFEKAVTDFRSRLQQVDEIYLMYLFGSTILAPVKIGERTYPHLAEFDQYLHKSLGLNFD